MVDKRSLRYKIGICFYRIAGLIAAYGLYLSGAQLIEPNIHKKGTNKIAKELTERYGLVVRFGDPSEFFVPLCR